MCLILHIYNIGHILHIGINVLLSPKDSDQLVDFYWIDPMYAAEQTAAKSKHHDAGKLYFQLEKEGSWEWPGLRALAV